MRITSVHIKNFRSIRDQRVDSIDRALVFVGQNNCGKSSLLNAIRAFFSNYTVRDEDFHKDTGEIEITIGFSIDNNYINSFALDSRIGIGKVPSAAAEYNSLKDGTDFHTISYQQFKDARDIIIENCDSAQEIINSHEPNLLLWKKAINNRFKVRDNSLILKYRVNRHDLKSDYYDIDNEKVKDINAIFPKIAFIDDDRNFDEEQTGKANTLTNDLFGKHIIRKGRVQDEVACTSCFRDTCDQCMDVINQKDIIELTITDLEKLLKNKIKSISNEVSDKISSFFETYYNRDYKIVIDPKSNVDKSFSVSTKLFDPNLNKQVELSNVGSGIRSIYILSLLEAYHELCNNNCILFLIEEPEIYLHPSLQKIMGSILYEISKENQILFSTHSPLMLRDFALEEIKKVSLNNRFETIVQETTMGEVLNELGYSTEDILQTDCVIFVEGKDDKDRLRKLINKYYDLDTENIYFVDTKSCNNIETYATLRFLNKTFIRDNFLIIRDSDTQDTNLVKTNLLNKFRENLGAEYFNEIADRILVLSFSSLECYFLNPSILQTLRLVRNIDDYNNRIENHITRNREPIVQYLNEKNDTARAAQLESLIYSPCTIPEKLDDCKKYLRGHNLFGIFGTLKNKIGEYIDISTPNDFEEILNHLNSLEYFNSRKNY